MTLTAQEYHWMRMGVCAGGLAVSPIGVLSAVIYSALRWGTLTGPENEWLGAWLLVVSNLHFLAWVGLTVVVSWRGQQQDDQQQRPRHRPAYIACSVGLSALTAYASVSTVLWPLASLFYHDVNNRSVWYEEWVIPMLFTSFWLFIFAGLASLVARVFFGAPLDETPG
jgi:hypothetical protein